MQSATDLVRQGQRLRYRHGQQRQGGSRGRGSRGGGSAGPRRGRGGGGPRTCYRCGLPGHIRRDCPQPADGDAPRPAGVAAGGRKRDRTPSAAAPHPGAAAAHLPPSQLLLVLSNADLVPLLLRWLPLWTICSCRRLCREALRSVDAELAQLRSPLAVGGFSMRVQGYGTGKFLRGCEAFDWAGGRWLQWGHLPTARADHTLACGPAPPFPSPYAHLHSLPAGAANCPLRVQRPRCLARTSTWRSRGSSCWVA